MKISKNMKNLLIIGALVGVVVGAWAVWYVFFKPHRDVGSEKPQYTLTSQALSDAFKNDTTAMGTYVDKAILVEGTITGLEGKHVSLGNIICSMDSVNALKIGSLKSGDAVKIQGRLTSYNDLMEEIMMDNCVFK